jgi:TP901 family phage tail tape measure protein
MASSEKITIDIVLKDSASAGVKAIGKSIRSIGNASKSVLSSVTSLKGALVGIGSGLVISDLTRTFITFDDAMKRAGATAGAIGEQLKAMTLQATQLGETTAFSATQAAEAFQFLAQAGLSVDEAMAALPGVLDLASAASLDLAEAADIATNVLSGFGLPVEELTRVNDVLAKTADSSNTSVRELGEAFKTAAPAAKAAGISIEQTAAVLGGLGNNAIKGSEGGNAFKRILLELQAATPRTTAELERLGVTVKDSEGNYRDIIPILQDFEILIF